MNSTREMRHRAIAAGWLKADETPLFSRLRFPMSLDHPDCIFDENRAARDAVLTELLSGDVRPMPNSPCLSHSNDHDIVLSEVDRYNLPLRTVLSACTGLVRSDPYYPPQFLQKFYAQHYRQLYRGKKYSAGHFMAEQITHGQRIMWRTALSKRARVLDVGCGMGGNLIPFKWEGHETIGCDWGEDYAQKGRQLGLDIRVGGLDAVADAGPFDLIICSHVLEHAVDPIDFAQSIAGLLAEDGALYIEVPGLLHIAKTYAGNFLLYLQNAHAWHFTSSTLAAVLARAGLAIEQSDESIWCVAKKQAVLRTPWPQDGQRVLNELLQLENQFTYLRAAA